MITQVRLILTKFSASILEVVVDGSYLRKRGPKSLFLTNQRTARLHAPQVTATLPIYSTMSLGMKHSWHPQ